MIDVCSAKMCACLSRLILASAVLALPLLGTAAEKPAQKVDTDPKEQQADSRDVSDTPAAVSPSVSPLVSPSVSPTINPSIKPAARKNSSDSVVVTLQSTITGNREQPTVLYIVPWQAPDGPESLRQGFQSDMDNLFQPVERVEFLRQLRHRGVPLKGTDTQNRK